MSQRCLRDGTLRDSNEQFASAESIKHHEPGKHLGGFVNLLRIVSELSRWHIDCIPRSGPFWPLNSMRVRIVKVPPASRLEGLDLRPFKLRSGETRNLRSPVADVLVDWGYAEPVLAAARPTKSSRVMRKK